MNVTLNKVLWLTAGAVIGAAVASKYFKTKYERIAQEEIDSVKRAFSESRQSESDDAEEIIETVSEPDPDATVEAYEQLIIEQGYSADGSDTAKSSRKEVKGVSKPRVISPAEFDTLDDYEVYSLTYYADGVLTDEQNNPVEDIEALVGRDSLTHFGEYEDDSVHVRNDAMMCDFEILKDLSKYSDVFRAGARPDDD